ncbi:hypothetical protein [Kribbella kalugense]|uniref:Uncharacterized protein n=1 Tax=Kribbella kalugense TaxID=2512221 RepID=A0A4R7ZJ13_9ACTN|nr:hypothetical protein [Kribbella kalugense]TDW17275.1 hypothetical protein EV650_3840 [Kribbella kalugense]
MAQSRGKLIDELTDNITGTALASVNLSAEDRVLARHRVRDAIAAEATGAHRDVVAAARGDEDSQFSAYLTGARQLQQYRGEPEADASPARKLAAELVAADSLTSGLPKETIPHAEDYIAHAITFAAEAEARKTAGGPSQAPAAAALGAAAGPAGPGAAQAVPPAAAVVAPPVAAVKAGPRVPNELRGQRNGGSSIG